MGKTMLNTSSHHFNPIQGCSRCGAPNHTTKQQQIHRRVPGWFYGSRSLAELSKIPSLNPQKDDHCYDSTDFTGKRYGKVQEWLQTCDRTRKVDNSVENRMSSLMQGRTKLEGRTYETVEDEETNKRVESWIDTSDKALKSHSVKTDLELHLSHKYSKKMPLNTRFSRYLSNDGDFYNSHVKRHVGPIQRPHTPNTDLYERQKMRFGSKNLNAAKKSSFVDFANMRNRTSALHSEVKTMLME